MRHAGDLSEMSMSELWVTDPNVYWQIRWETARQQKGIELIPSENFVSKAVLQALGTPFTNKYSEGYPGRRYYGGQEFVDKIERLAIDRAKELFCAEHVNVQPYSGSPANHAVYYALMNHGDRLMGLDQSCGGHLTHGSSVNFSGRDYKVVPYAVNRETELIDIDEVHKLAIKNKPKIIVSSLTAYPRKLDFRRFQEICEEVDAYHLADISHIAGLVAGGVHDSPFPYTDIVTTTTQKSLRGPRGAIIMCKEVDRLRKLYHPDEKRNLARRIDSAVFPGLQGGPHMNVIAAKAVALKEAGQPKFKMYAVQMLKNAKVMADELMNLGMKLVTDGTDNHLMLIDLRPTGLAGKGKQLQNALDVAGITVNKNQVPFDEAKPFNPSGLRLGTPAVTTRGMKEEEMKIIAEYVVRVIRNYRDELLLKKIRKEVTCLSQRFPLYKGYDVLK